MLQFAEEWRESFEVVRRELVAYTSSPLGNSE